MYPLRRVRQPAAVIAGIAAVSAFGTAPVMAADGDAAPDEKLQEVVVTGSLISEPNRASPSPIVITTMEDLKQSGTVTLEASLNQLPQFAPAGSAGNGGQGTGGHATVNLH